MNEFFIKKDTLLIVRVIFVVAGLYFGWRFFWDAFGALFVGGLEGAPYTFLPFALFVILAAKYPRIGGLLMIAESLISFICYALVWPVNHYEFFLKYSLPIVIFGISFLVLGIISKKMDLQTVDIELKPNAGERK